VDGKTCFEMHWFFFTSNDVLLLIQKLRKSKRKSGKKNIKQNWNHIFLAWFVHSGIIILRHIGDAIARSIYTRQTHSRPFCQSWSQNYILIASVGSSHSSFDTSLTNSETENGKRSGTKTECRECGVYMVFWANYLADTFIASPY